MDDLKRIEGKTIQSIGQGSDGKNSFLIIKFKEGGKVNITAHINGDDGIAQLGIEPENKSFEGKIIHSVVEEFDGSNDFLIFNFKSGDKLTITSFSSTEDSTSSLDISVYSSEKLVAETLEESVYENEYSDARNGKYPLQNIQYESGEDEHDEDEDE